MKKYLALAAALVLLLGIAPVGMGSLAQRRIDRGVDTLVASTPWLRVVERRWTRGWFGSEQLLTVELVLGKPLRFTVRNDVQHGPVPGFTSLGAARVRSHLVLDDATRAQLRALLGTDEPFRLQTRVGFFGGGKISLTGDAHQATVANQDGSRIAWDAFHLDIGLTSSGEGYTLDGRQPRIEVSGAKPGEQLLLSDLRIDGQGTRIVGDLFDTDMEVHVGSMRFAQGGSAFTEMDDLHYIVDSERQGDFLDVAARMGTGALRNPALQAMGLDLKKVHYDFTMRHLHIPTLEQLMAKMKAAQKGDPALAMQPAQLFGALSEPGTELLRHAPQFVVDRIGIETAEGDGMVRGTVRFDGVTEADLAGGFQSLLGRLVAEFTVEVASALVQKMPQGAAASEQLVQQGYLRRQADKLVAELVFRQGQLRINGRVQGMPWSGAAAAAPPAPEPRTE